MWKNFHPLNYLLAIILILASFSVLFPQWPIPCISLGVTALSFLDLLFHEIGHILFGLLGSFIGVLGGTIAQLLWPTAVLFSALRHRNLSLVSFFIFWLGENCINVSHYMADARTQTLRLFNPFPLSGHKPIHDWHYILSTLHLLWADQLLSWFVYLIGILIMAFAILRLLIPEHLAQWWVWLRDYRNS